MLENIKRGDILEFSWIGTKWVKRIFIAYVKGASQPYICVNRDNEDNFYSGEKFSTESHSEARIIEEPEIEIIVKKKGKEVKLSSISFEILADLWSKDTGGE